MNQWKWREVGREVEPDRARERGREGGIEVKETKDERKEGRNKL